MSLLSTPHSLMSTRRFSIVSDAPSLVSATSPPSTVSSNRSSMRSPLSQLFSPTTPHGVTPLHILPAQAVIHSANVTESVIEQRAPSDEPRVLCTTLRFYNVLVLSFSLMLLFAAFNTLQQWMTSMLGSLGNTALTIIYIAVCSALMFTPMLTERLTHKWAILLGASCYLLFMGSLAYGSTPLILACSAVNGFGASLLWVSVGGFMTKCSTNADRGFNTGVFWSIFQMSLIIGNVVAYFMINYFTATELFIVFTIIGAIGTCMLLLLAPFPSPNSPAPNRVESDRGVPSPARIINTVPPTPTPTMTASNSKLRIVIPPTPQASTIQSVRPYRPDMNKPLLTQSASEGDAPAVVEVQIVKPPPTVASLLRAIHHIVTQTPIVLLMPAFLYQGIEFSFWNGEFPHLFDQQELGLILLWAGVGECVGGLTMGMLSQRIGTSMTWMVGVLLFLLGLGGVFAVKMDYRPLPIVNVTILAYLCSFAFGLADATFNTQIYTLLGNMYKKEVIEEEFEAGETILKKRANDDDSDAHVVAGFTCFNFLQNIGAAIGFFYQPYLPLVGDGSTDYQIFIQAAVTIIAAVGFIACEQGWAATICSGRTNNDEQADDSVSSDDSADLQYRVAPDNATATVISTKHDHRHGLAQEKHNLHSAQHNGVGGGAPRRITTRQSDVQRRLLEAANSDVASVAADRFDRPSTADIVHTAVTAPNSPTDALADRYRYLATDQDEILSKV